MISCTWSAILYLTAAASLLFQPSCAQGVAHYWKPSGKYTSVCIDKRKNDRVLKLLTSLRHALTPVFNDLIAKKPDGTPNPSAAYLTFFKDAKNMPFVREMFVRVLDGNSEIPVDDGGKTFPDGQYKFSQGGSPVFWSITQLGEVSGGENGQVDVYTLCNENPDNTANYVNPSPYITLCPAFWEAGEPVMFGGIPPKGADGVPAENCLGLSRRAKLFNPTDGANGTGLIQWRMWILMEELLHYYIQLSTGRHGADSQRVNDVVRLSAADSLYTVQAYMYYAA
ncbi:MAG: hypothetical protein Q9174_005397, partial [Haloplaca sp. 1 TL-2023]